MGLKNTKMVFKDFQNIPIPTAGNTDLLVASKNAKSSEEDINGLKRTTFNIGVQIYQKH